MDKKTIAITGAAGLVGTGLREQLVHRGYAIRSLDLKRIENPLCAEESIVVDICDQTEMTKALKGCDAVVHLAACTTDAAWPDQIKLSIEGTVSVFDAARAAGVNRIVYASSHHVVGLHPRAPHGPVMAIDSQLRPDSRYAVGKAFGESIGALYAYKYGMQVCALRIGNVNTQAIDRRRLGSWLSWRDLGQLVSIGIEHPDIVFSVMYGISDATGRHYDNSTAFALGFKPEDGRMDEEAETAVMLKDPIPDQESKDALAPAETTLGGGFSQSEYVGDWLRVFR